MGLQWEFIDNKTKDTIVIQWPRGKRTKIPGGWLVFMRDGDAAGLTFYPDPEHKWDGNSLP